MCGFIVSRKGGNDRFIRRRGLNAATHFKRDGFTFSHWLLHITGDLISQPYVDGDVVMVYNGEIYNHKFTHSDGENIIPAYRDLSTMFPTALDGEFAIALYDFARDTAFFVTDRFATKPIWRNGAECASYESGVGGHKIPANTVEVVRISTGLLLYSTAYHVWDWEQDIDHYDDCITAFVEAVEKRYRPGCFIGLSSGYDSGAIACVLQKADFKAYCVMASERVDTVLARCDLLNQVSITRDPDLRRQERHLAENAEEFAYRIRYDDGPGTHSYKDDYAAKALSHICELAHNEGRKVMLSGMGADEILSDYSLIPNQSEFKGRYPELLRLWANFIDSCMYSYLGKEECVAGSWAIETRYPFLDTAFVQSFLSLKAELKNRHYKAPLYEYLTREGFPFQPDVKIGFCV